MFSEEIDRLIILVIASLGAMLTFIAVALPLLNRTEKREHYTNVIEKKRKILFDQAKEQVYNKKTSKKEEVSMSTRESLAFFFTVQERFGALGEKVRDQMLQAGIRDPKAPMIYLIARAAIPIVLMLLSWLVLANGEKEVESLTILIFVVFIGLAGFFMPKILMKNHIVKRQQEINLVFPDALDMMLICVQGGIGLEQTVQRVGDEIAEHSPLLAEELGILSAEMGMLNDRRRALQDFARRVGSGAAKSFATAMIQAEQYGTSISSAMRVISDELRDMRMAEAERKAASLPPKLTVPMILFFLPALFIVILVPAFLAAKAAGVGD
ncbi:MAG: type II secretion system F family protein [Alphaproteobacteria bacterium]|nr:type II secretion system F family protein [Alphaproteobacteria bacterium]MCB1551570.1 type II secretion system F family protein [Alphaproteobacteria bacterium]MCB9985193.1 type II secretion system F family protein [Micavibrio sp.]HRK98079.1 type II secretion system F family protein [Alphaproteobacteria bacterium]